MKIYMNQVKILKIIILVIMIIFLNTTKVNAVEDTVILEENWEEWQKEEYWEWHTRTTTEDKAYNGNHIVIKNDMINFYGYWKNSYKDFLYKEYDNPGKKIFKFKIDETKADYHTLDGAGFIFNANKEEDKLSGYILLVKEKNICIYRIDDVNIKTFEEKSDKTVGEYGSLITKVEKTNSTIHNLVVEATPTNIKIKEEETEIINENLDYSKHVGNSFGLISSYAQHSCSKLSEIEFSQLKITLEDYEINVLNTDLSNNPLTGGEFELKNENGELIKKGKTNKNGKFDIKGIKEGVYSIQQIKAPEGYILNDIKYEFKVTNEGKVIDIKTDKEISLIIKNEKKAIDKQDNNIDNNVNSIQKDNTTSSMNIPKAGEKVWTIRMTIVLFGIISIYLLIKFKKYKIVK